MKNSVTTLLFLSAAFTAPPSMAWTASEFYFTLSPTSINPFQENLNPALISDPYTNFIMNDKAYFTAVNIARTSIGERFVSFSPNYWSAVNFTGLDPVDRSASSQSGHAQFGTLPDYGQTAFQLDGQKVGLFLNTEGLQRPNLGIYSSALQLSKTFWTNAPSPWNGVNQDDRFCINLNVDLHSWAGPMVQAGIAVQFHQKNVPGQYIHFVYSMLDTNPANTKREFVMIDNANDSGMPIVHTYFQSQSSVDPDIKMSSPPPDYGVLLEAYTKESTRYPSTISNPKPYAVCTSYSQFQYVLSKVREQRPAFSANPEDFSFNGIVMGVEIDTQNTSQMNFIGVSVHDMNVYRISP